MPLVWESAQCHPWVPNMPSAGLTEGICEASAQAFAAEGDKGDMAPIQQNSLLPSPPVWGRPASFLP